MKQRNQVKAVAYNKVEFYVLIGPADSWGPGRVCVITPKTGKMAKKTGLYK